MGAICKQFAKLLLHPETDSNLLLLKLTMAHHFGLDSIDDMGAYLCEWNPTSWDNVAAYHVTHPDERVTFCANVGLLDVPDYVEMVIISPTMVASIYNECLLRGYIVMPHKANWHAILWADRMIPRPHESPSVFDIFRAREVMKWAHEVKGYSCLLNTIDPSELNPLNPDVYEAYLFARSVFCSIAQTAKKRDLSRMQ